MITRKGIWILIYINRIKIIILEVKNHISVQKNTNRLSAFLNPSKNKNKPAMWETNYNPNYPFQTDPAALYITKSHFIFSLIIH